MYQVIYISRLLSSLREEDLRSLQEEERQRNAHSGVTGALVAWQGCLLEVLEGDASSVLAAYERIRDDSRHAERREILAGPTPSRRFDDTTGVIISFHDPCPEVRLLMDRHPPLSLSSAYYRDPMRAFALLYDAVYLLSEASRARIGRRSA